MKENNKQTMKYDRIIKKGVSYRASGMRLLMLTSRKTSSFDVIMKTSYITSFFDSGTQN